MGAMGALAIIAFVGLFLGLAGTAAVIFGIIYAGRRFTYALKGEPYRPMLGAGKGPEYQYQDVDAGANETSIRAVFRRYMQTTGVSKYARAGISQLEGATRKATSFRAVLDTKFQPGSITWDKFSVAASSAQEAVLRNCATLANDIQAFDHADYKRLEQARRRSAFRSDIRLDATQEEQYRLLQVKLGNMEAITNANEKVLLELDKLSAELDKLGDAGSSDESERLIEEIRQLTAETKYYQQGLDNMR